MSVNFSNHVKQK